jgi:hypothetical protein
MADARAIAVLQLLYTETTPQSGFFLKKKPPSIEPVRTYVLENRSRSLSGIRKCKFAVFPMDSLLVPCFSQLSM